MRRFYRDLGVLAIFAAGVALQHPAVGVAATDSTPPTLTAPLAADFVVGSTIGPERDPSVGLFATSGIRMRAKWRATDPSGICGYSIRKEWAGLEPTNFTPWGPTTSVTEDNITDYIDEQGGGSEKFLGYAVRARDCAGNIARKFITFYPHVYQEDGNSWNGGTLPQPPTYKGTWRTSKCNCFSGGATRKTTQRRASVTFNIGPRTAGSFGPGHHAALVMEKGPTRGSVRIYVNGTLKATVSTFSATIVHRAVVWNGTPRGATIKLVNVGTAGHPRVDLDAILSD